MLAGSLVATETNSLPSKFAENENAKWVLLFLDATGLRQAGRKLLTY